MLIIKNKTAHKGHVETSLKGALQSLNVCGEGLLVPPLAVRGTAALCLGPLIKAAAGGARWGHEVKEEAETFVGSKYKVWL